MENKGKLIRAIAAFLLISNAGLSATDIAAAQETGEARNIDDAIRNGKELQKGEAQGIQAIQTGNCGVGQSISEILDGNKDKIADELSQAMRFYRSAAEALDAVKETRRLPADIRDDLARRGLEEIQSDGALAHYMAMRATESADAIQGLLNGQDTGANLHRLTENAGALNYFALLLLGFAPSS